MADNKDFTPQEYEDLIKELIKENEQLKKKIAELEHRHQEYRVQRETIDAPKPVIETHDSIVDMSPPKITEEKFQSEKLVEKPPIEEEIKPIEQTHKRIHSESIFSENVAPLEMHKGDIMIGDSRRECPKCGNKNKALIRETVDKTHIICNYPRMYGKKYHCGDCGVEWRVPIEM
ncbi:MAG: hypothetical protein ACFFCE_15100 [Promethearchaeota archaeon]